MLQLFDFFRMTSVLRFIHLATSTRNRIYYQYEPVWWMKEWILKRCSEYRTFVNLLARMAIESLLIVNKCGLQTRQYFLLDVTTYRCFLPKNIHYGSLKFMKIIYWIAAWLMGWLAENKMAILDIRIYRYFYTGQSILQLKEAFCHPRIQCSHWLLLPISTTSAGRIVR